jgi:hypothetical protein
VVSFEIAFSLSSGAVELPVDVFRAEKADWGRGLGAVGYRAHAPKKAKHDAVG